MSCIQVTVLRQFGTYIQTSLALPGLSVQSLLFAQERGFLSDGDDASSADTRQSRLSAHHLSSDLSSSASLFGRETSSRCPFSSVTSRSSPLLITNPSYLEVTLWRLWCEEFNWSVCTRLFHLLDFERVRTSTGVYGVSASWEDSKR